MAVNCDIGVADIQVLPGAHICGMYRGLAERDAILVAFLNAGLAAGDKCICVIDDGEPSDAPTGTWRRNRPPTASERWTSHRASGSRWRGRC